MLGPNSILNGRYRLIEKVGEGGMASVFRALDLRLGRTVAIKILHAQFDRDTPFLQRFQQEAEFAASLGAHPNIVAIYDIGQDNATHYIVMEFVDGRSLKDVIEEFAPFTVAEAFAVGRQVASALDFAHKRGLVHRDVKPQNIMVTVDGVAKVTDFGIARSLTTSQLTSTGMVIGTVHYFSPEQAQGKPAGPQADIYSLGVILFEMLTGHLPFDAENAIGVAMQHVNNAPPSPLIYNPGLPPRAVALVMRALEKDPNNRYRDAAEFAGALGGQAPPDKGNTTIFAPVQGPSKQQTAVFVPEPAEPIRPVRERVVRDYAPRESAAGRSRAVRTTPTNPWRTAWMALTGALLLLAIGVGAFLFSNHIFGAGTSATPTPSATPKPKSTAKPRPTHVPPTTPPTAAPLPTFTPVPFVPTKPPAPTPTPQPPPPTATATLRPTAAPTATEIPNIPTPTPQPPAVTPTPSPAG